MADSQQPPAHPGRHIRDAVLPKGLSVTAAAERLGVGRPALSNLLNGKASLSPDMAMRFERAFGANREDLLKRQAEYDDFGLRDRGKNMPVRSYAQSAIQIHARDIEAWATGNLEARATLPAFLRRLVNTTGVNLMKVDFPAHDNSQRHGWDGQTETDTANRWIPSGKAGWEFGCNEDPAKKAEKDYQARLKNVSAEERLDTTFVFVTPQNWPGKEDWAKTKRVSAKWKNVVALDASDIEQWLEQSISTQYWIAEQMGIASEEVFSLEKCWARWASATQPELIKQLFRDSVDSHKRTLDEWLKQPATKPLVVTATSTDEALACLACLFEHVGRLPGSLYDRVIAVHSVAAFQTATRALPNFIAVVVSPEVEKALAGFQKRQHTIIVRTQNAVMGDADISLDLPSHDTFKEALVAMGFEEENVERMARETGNSPTILRRRLSQIEAIKFPPWTQDKRVVRDLIPIALVGVWKSDTVADQEILASLSGKPYQEVERTFAEILQMEQTPLWSIDRYRGLTSKIETLYAIHRSITRDDLERFCDTASYVLVEDDPALDLPEDQRWAANLYGKSRNHSGAIREALCETLVLLAVHGNNLFQKRLGINVEAKVNAVVRDLLESFDPKTWLSQHHDLPRYAEAAPEQFLEIIEQDLKSSSPRIHSLLQPSDAGLMGSCPRSGLLWALELLAWKPERLVRVASILARLCQTEIHDNWSNKPENSLEAIFRCWIPQTAASVDQRKAALETLVRLYPDVAWRICIDQFDPGSRVGHYNERPRWRNDAARAGQVVTRSDIHQFARKALDLALDWQCHTDETLGDLVARMQGIPVEDQERVWILVSTWNAQRPDDGSRARLRERIRRYAFTRRGRKLGQNVKDRAREIYDLLAPEDVVERHAWLFAQHWVEESADELQDEAFDYRKREERIGELRATALKDVWSEKGIDGIKELCASGNAAATIGWHLAASVIAPEDATDFIHKLTLTRISQDIDPKLDDCIAGFVRKLDEAARDLTISGLIARYVTTDHPEIDSAIRLLRCAPCEQATWKQVDALPEALRRRYWREVSPDWGKREPSDVNRMIDEFLQAGRAVTAFTAFSHDVDAIETPRLVRLLRALTASESETDHHRIPQHDVTSAFESLDKRTDISKDELAQLEFMFIKALEHTERGIPHLSEHVAQAPQLFVQALALTYKRRDDGEDPAEWILPEERKRTAWQAAYAVLENAKRIPGSAADGTIDPVALVKWIAEARTLAEKYARKEVGDSSIGKILSSCAVGTDGIWPCEPVRQVVEEIASNEMASGISIGVYNSRGARWRGDGSEEERALAAKYRNWAQQLAFEFPFVAKMLESMAQNYEHDARHWETDRKVQRKLRH